MTQKAPIKNKMLPKKTWMYLATLGFILSVFTCILYLKLTDSFVPGADSPLRNSQGTIAARHFHIPILLTPKYWTLPYLSQNSKHISLSDIQGYPTIINFWASWCTTCAEESPMLKQVWSIYATNTSLQMIGVVLHDDPKKAREYAQTTEKNYMIAYDGDGKMAIDYGVSGVPETIFILPSGKVYDKVVGALSSHTLIKNTEAILKTTKTSASL